MRLFIAILFALPSAALLGQDYGDDSISSLIKKLGSGSFQERQAATKALQDRPDAVPALREIVRSADLEMSRRAQEILDYQDRRPMRELDTAVKEGRVERAIELLAGWPKGKQENEVWAATCTLGRNLTVLHLRQGGQKNPLQFDWHDAIPDCLVVSAGSITEATKAPRNPLDKEKVLFLRAREVEIDYHRKEKLKGKFETRDMQWLGVIVASGSVRLRALGGHQPYAVFAGGDVELDGGFVGVTIVSCGDVNLKECTISGSLVIARGKVICGGQGYINNRIIAGNSVGTRGERRGSIITENETNPLGYIRWSKEPKENATPKSK